MRRIILLLLNCADVFENDGQEHDVIERMKVEGTMHNNELLGCVRTNGTVQREFLT